MLVRSPTALLLLAALARAAAGSSAPLGGTEPLAAEAPLAHLANAGWHRHLDSAIAQSHERRAAAWTRDFTPPALPAAAIAAKRARLARMIGAIDERIARPRLEIVRSSETPEAAADRNAIELHAVRWPALAGVNGDGVLVQPRGVARALVILVPDADTDPATAVLDERQPTARIARRLAASGARVLVPALARRAAIETGDVQLRVFTNQSQREWLYRQAAPSGRHIIGYEVQKIRAAADALRADGAAPLPIAIIGYGEGGLLALLAAALDDRITATWIGGYFGPREAAWREPLERQLHGQLAEFGDAEIAALVAPQALVVEHCAGPAVVVASPATGPAHLRSAAPGELRPVPADRVRAEFERAHRLAGAEAAKRLTLLGDGHAEFGGEAALARWADEFRFPLVASSPRLAASALPAPDPQRVLRELQEHAQAAVRAAEARRAARAAIPPAEVARQRASFAREAIGVVEPTSPLAPARSRFRADLSTPRFTVHEVALDVAAPAFTWGLLLLPTDLRPGERRAVVVCQHGSGGVPADTINPDRASRAHQIYQAYAARLAERGFVVFAPYLINRAGGDDYRAIARKADLLGLSLFSLMNASHARLLAWLRAQPFADPGRVALYGMSYGAKAAIRAAAALDGYATLVLSGDFNDNAAVVSTVRHDRNEAMFYPDHDLTEWGLAERFNYAEMLALFAPRPAMVEFGYADRAVQLEGAAAEFARAQLHYARHGAGERIAIEFFEGGHTVPGRGTFEFLARWLRHP